MMTKTIKWTLQLVNEPNLLKESNTGFILISQKFPDYLCKIFAMSNVFVVQGLIFQIGATWIQILRLKLTPQLLMCGIHAYASTPTT